MTIIIGALCDGGSGAIFCSDMVTILNYPAVVLENTPKIISITRHAIVLTSGIVSNYLFLEEARINATKLSKIEQMADSFATGYRIFRLRKIELEILPLHGFYSLDNFFSKQKMLNDSLVGGISEQIKSVNLWVDLLVGGIDELAHIYQISHPGTFLCHDIPGFCCLGAGGNRASSVFDYFKYSKEMTKDRVLEIVYCGKKRSEKIGGIGEKTDIKILTKEGTQDITPAQLELVEKKYQDEKSKNPDYWQ